MSILDLLRTPWAIDASKLSQLQDVYDTHVRGDKINLTEARAELGLPLENKQATYEVRQGGVAVLEVNGVIAPKANLFTNISGGASADMLTAQIDAAAADPSVRGLVLSIDSPGGSVKGTPMLADAMRAFSKVKPSAAVGAQMASAAYWVGSSANAVFASELTSQIGSIGVVATHEYTPNKRSEVTEITAGKYKRMASSHKPLDPEGKEYIQGQVDHLQTVFVDAVADNRGVTPDVVNQNMADGRIFYGQQAVDVGLVDGVATVNQVVALMAADPSRFAKRTKARIKPTTGNKSTSAGVAALGEMLEQQVALRVLAESFNSTATLEMGDLQMADANTLTAAAVPALTIETLQRDHGALHAQILAAGAAQERDRISAVREQVLPGHEALIEKLAADGKTTGAEAAMAVNAAQRTALAAAAAAHKADAPAAVKSSASTESTTVKSKAEKAAEAKAYAVKNGVDFLAAYKALGFDA